MRFSNAAAMKAMDAYTIDVLGVPSDSLMLRAAAGAADEAERMLTKRPGKAAVFCGSGNNGGDGIAVAMLLLKNGFQVRCFMAGNKEKMTPDSMKMEQLLLSAGGVLEEPEAAGPLSDYALLVDALFGTGLSREISGKYAHLIDAINASGVPVLACDIPSGIHADDGSILGHAVRATVTVTFNLPKTGQLLPPGSIYTGRLVVHDIGIPEEAKKTVSFDGELLTVQLVRSWLPQAAEDAHKGTFGKLLLLCGSTGFTGAAAMAAMGALRTGAGLVFLGVPESVYPIVATKLNEPVVFPLPSGAGGQLSREALPELQKRLSGMNACLFGPGIGTSVETAAVAEALLQLVRCPLVLDADGLNVFAGKTELLKKVKVPLVLTPHEGEFARLGGDLSQGRIKAAHALSEQTGVVVVLKGYRTVIASPDGRLYVNSTGNSGMAVGGSGDVLAGMITCLLGQGVPAAEAAAAAVWLHGAAGDLCRKRLGRRSMLPSDMLEALPEVFLGLEEE